MNTLKYVTMILLVLILAGIIVVIVSLVRDGEPALSPSPSVAASPAVTPAFLTTRGNRDIIVLDSPLEGQSIDNPVTIRGRARGQWYFEASFPITVVNWDGLIIAQGHAQAQGEWMTNDYVPFTATLSFPSPYKAGDPDFMRRGGIILQKDNPSGLPEHDDALEITVFFK